MLSEQPAALVARPFHRFQQRHAITPGLSASGEATGRARRGMHTSQALLGAALISCAAAMAPTTIRSATPKYAPMPDMLTSTVPGTWAHDTMSRRVVEDILDKVRSRRPVV